MPSRSPDAALPPAAPRREQAWVRQYSLRLFLTDIAVLAVVLSLYGLTFVRNESLVWPGGPTLSYALTLVLIGLVWLASLDIFETKQRLIVGHGVVEYRRIISATIFTFTAVMSVAFFGQIEMARSLFLVAVPIGMVALLLGRWWWRQWLRKQQHAGQYVFRAVLLGERAKIAHIARQIKRSPGSGYIIVGAVTPDGEIKPLGDVPVFGGIDDTIRAIESTGADTLVFGGSDELDPEAVRKLGWAMADRDVNWVVAPALTDIAGPRIHARPVAGLPLVHVDFPRLEGYRRVAKRTFDIVAGVLLMIPASLVMAVAAILVRAEGPGPVFYSQLRVGRRGRIFRMYKLRSMVPGADQQLAGLLDVQGTSAQPFFKIDNDPRITKIGKKLRRHSIDELPQLINVVRGQMSLVGPRPQVPSEVALYDDVVERRLLVKPGMSGLWQVSGRSQLSTEDAIRFDLYYVENWSFAQDMQILFRTFKAVVRPGKSAH